MARGNSITTLGLLALVMCVSSAAAQGNQTDSGRMPHKSQVRVLKLGMLMSDGTSSISQSVRGSVLRAANRYSILVDMYTRIAACDASSADIEKAVSEITAKGAVFIISRLCSTATLTAAKAAEAAGAILIAVSATSPNLTTDGGPNFFRTAPSDFYQGQFIAQRLLDTSALKKLLILNEDTVYAKGLMQVLNKSFASFYNKKSTIITLTNKTAAKVDLGSKPDVIAIFANNMVDAGTALKSIRSQGFNGTVYGGDSLLSNELLAAAGSAADSKLMVTHGSLGSAVFVALHKEKLGEMPTAYAAQAYDAMHAIEQAIKSAWFSTDVARLLRGMHEVAIKTSASNGGTGIAFNANNGDIKKFNLDSYVLSSVKDGAFVQQ